MAIFIQRIKFALVMSKMFSWCIYFIIIFTEIVYFCNIFKTKIVKVFSSVVFLFLYLQYLPYCFSQILAMLVFVYQIVYVFRTKNENKLQIYKSTIEVIVSIGLFVITT